MPGALLDTGFSQAQNPPYPSSFHLTGDPPMFAFASWTLWASAAAFLVLLYLLMSIRRIGPTEVGLVTKRLGWRRLSQDNPIAFDGEAGYQADLLMPGLRFKACLVYAVHKSPWVQVPAGEIGVVIAQVGRPLPIGAKSAVYRKEFENFTDLRNFVRNGGQK